MSSRLLPTLRSRESKGGRKWPTMSERLRRGHRHWVLARRISSCERSSRKRLLVRFGIGVTVTLERKIAEGGQAVIYEASLGRRTGYFVAKVFKMDGFSLSNLHHQWPRATMKAQSGSEAIKVSSWKINNTFGGVVFDDWLLICCEVNCCTFLTDGRFAFLFKKYWCDSRTLINRRLVDNHYAAPPFLDHVAFGIMRDIALGLKSLHDKGVLHRDLKAANVLIHALHGDPSDSGRFSCNVADYETSLLVQGTGFWRALDVLEDLLKKPCERNKEIWTEKVDVYSYAMTCYEVLTGHTPFWGYTNCDWERVIEGERPHLPDYIDPELLELVERCWHKDPSERPTFKSISIELGNMLEIYETRIMMK